MFWDYVVEKGNKIVADKDGTEVTVAHTMFIKVFTTDGKYICVTNGVYAYKRIAKVEYDGRCVNVFVKPMVIL